MYPTNGKAIAQIIINFQLIESRATHQNNQNEYEQKIN